LEVRINLKNTGGENIIKSGVSEHGKAGRVLRLRNTADHTGASAGRVYMLQYYAEVPD